MEKSKIIKRTIGGVLIGGILLTSGVAFADTDSTNTNKTSVGEAVYGQGKFEGRGGFHGSPGQGMGHGHGMKGGFNIMLSQESLDQLVSDGVISQDKANQVKAYIDKLAEERETKMEEFKNLTEEERQALKEKDSTKKDGSGQRGDFKERKDIFTDLVSNSILTQEEVDAIQAYMKEKAVEENRQRISDNLNDLVQKGTLTQDQVEKILAKYEEIEDEREAQLEKMKNMTEEERKEYFENKKSEDQKPQDCETQLVEAGIITQEQADAIKTNMQEKAEQERQQKEVER